MACIRGDGRDRHAARCYVRLVAEDILGEPFDDFNMAIDALREQMAADGAPAVGDAIRFAQRALAEEGWPDPPTELEELPTVVIS